VLGVLSLLLQTIKNIGIAERLRLSLALWLFFYFLSKTPLNPSGIHQPDTSKLGGYILPPRQNNAAMGFSCIYSTIPGKVGGEG